MNDESVYGVQQKQELITEFMVKEGLRLLARQLEFLGLAFTLG